MLLSLKAFSLSCEVRGVRGVMPLASSLGDLAGMPHSGGETGEDETVGICPVGLPSWEGLRLRHWEG